MEQHFAENANLDKEICIYSSFLQRHVCGGSISPLHSDSVWVSAGATAALELCRLRDQEAWVSVTGKQTPCRGGRND